MRAALALLAVMVACSGCLGIDNMGELKAALGFVPAPLAPDAPVPHVRTSATVVPVGQAIVLSAEGSRDPQGFALTFAWDFGDGSRAQGAEVTHRWAAPGIYTVRLLVRNAAGLENTEAALITVLDNRPPTAALEVRRGDAAAERALVGEELTFVAQAQDPEGGALTLAWDFGDGASAGTPEATHTYARGGRYTVTLRATDGGGLVAEDQRALPVDELRSDPGTVALTKDRVTHQLDIAEHVQRIAIGVRFDALLGVNALRVRLVDAQGGEVAALDASPPLGSQGPHEGLLDVAAPMLQGHAPGAWSIEVERTSGLSVPYDLTVEVRY
ncbi:MAG TPA: PKD domain-containing protein [Candidatus Thermoplasmatota archaeon]|nr:PKD domain-containing protein [Candidatus Thermoplasmatota archaeon]